METNPRLWTYSSSNSPVLIPHTSILFTQNHVYTLESPEFEDVEKELHRTELLELASKYHHEQTKLDILLQQHQAPTLSERFPILLAGECANPYRMQDMNIGPIPLLIVRLEHLCRTWADSLDAREVKPGIHHVTLARSEGWWEQTMIGLATKPQMKAIIEWMNEGNRDSWKAVKLDEGGIRLQSQSNIVCPTTSDIAWDGEQETVTASMPAADGPIVSNSEIFVPLHVRLGCYNNRGRISRCAHINQRDFHEKLFRRGSSFKWNEVISTK
ncbi:MAG: hypothetical protein VW230_05720 [Candidatus Poseidoniales archaeon]